jgi:hypothetical protein
MSTPTRAIFPITLLLLAAGGCDKSNVRKPESDPPVTASNTPSSNSSQRGEGNVRPRSPTHESVDEDIDNLLQMDVHQLDAFFVKLNATDPGRSCELILRLPASKQESLLPNAVLNLALADPDKAFSVVDSLPAGTIRGSCVWALGKVLHAQDWQKLGPAISRMFPEDLIALANASSAASSKDVSQILRSMQTSGIGGEALTITKSKLAYLYGRDGIPVDSPEIIPMMSPEERSAYIAGIISKDPKLALEEAVKMSKDSTTLLDSMGGPLIAAIFDKDDPARTAAMISSVDVGDQNHDVLVRNLFDYWVEIQPQSASDYISSMEVGDDRVAAIKSLIAYLMRKGDNEAASEWSSYLDQG